MKVLLCILIVLVSIIAIAVGGPAVGGLLIVIGIVGLIAWIITRVLSPAKSDKDDDTVYLPGERRRDGSIQR